MYLGLIHWGKCFLQGLILGDINLFSRAYLSQGPCRKEILILGNNMYFAPWFFSVLKKFSQEFTTVWQITEFFTLFSIFRTFGNNSVRKKNFWKHQQFRRGEITFLCLDNSLWLFIFLQRNFLKKFTEMFFPSYLRRS